MTAVYALYPDADSAQHAVDRLRAAGIDEGRITVISGEPYEEYAFAQGDRATWMFRIAAIGGVVGLGVATWLTTMTERAWPLKTGNMPIVAWWPNLIVMFELTMLFAIVSTVATLLVTARLPARGPRLYDPAVTAGRVLVGVENPAAGSTDAVERALLAAGVSEVRRV